MSLWRRIIRRKRTRTRSPAKHYVAHKEAARVFVHERLKIVNQIYGFAYNRVAIRDQKSRWGSCSTKGNLNFNYRIQFLPLHLADYIIAHELCHLKEFNHGKGFWDLVTRAAPEHEKCCAELRKVHMKRGGGLDMAHLTLE